ncbi:MAG: D-sedoheptulose-7-phosphate isomerase [Desulfurella sp.]|uniref:Phosphoheptose isomerase n=1 Tax=Desulfurella multipotens TaxID=79269 RepID=A0A1G6JT36_9BACT|nr:MULTISPECIES: SIS domain-containing protein [Desulfurella]AHF97166.1 phosphoheptose isomerase [Desulfurella acetivorans A63]PMP68454.1 MAG: SIS domain-containing protein [Desulfurella multipotens]PMP92472.1 MAG: SIS domain-containing protein [Desulfurella sp.]SDC21884.1 phosphoheptose isomerase [Desulfurella multipotens]
MDFVELCEQTAQKFLQLQSRQKELENISTVIFNALSNNNKLLIFGNGGSAADAQHMAAELVGRFLKERKAISAIALTTDTSIITSIANDYSFDKVFERQIDALGKRGDIAFGISTSGNSKNVYLAIKKANEIGLTTIALLGKDGGIIKDIAKISFIVDSNYTPTIQELHIFIIHNICKIIEDLWTK